MRVFYFLFLILTLSLNAEILIVKPKNGTVSSQSYNSNIIRLSSGIEIHYNANYEELKNSRRYNKIEKNIRADIREIPNDPLFWELNSIKHDRSSFLRKEQQWYLENRGFDSEVFDLSGNIYPQYFEPAGNTNASIHILKAWEIINESPNQIIAVIDSGVDTNNLDFKDSIYDYKVFANYNLEHGTKICSLIASKGNNSLGMAGVTWKTKLMILQTDFQLSSILQAIDYAVNNGSKIISCSWGFLDQTDLEFNLLRDEIIWAGTSNVIFIASAMNGYGNEDLLNDAPLKWRLDNVIGVVATDRRDNLYSYAGVNTTHIASPGRVLIVGDIGNTYSYSSGSSFSTALVSGIISLIKEKYGNEDYLTTKYRLLNSVDYLGLPVKTGGRVNAYKALLPMQEPSLDIKIENGGVNIRLSNLIKGLKYTLFSSKDLTFWQVNSNLIAEKEITEIKDNIDEIKYYKVGFLKY